MYLLHRFPADPDLKRQWLSAVNRKDFVPSPSSRVCSEHFVDGRKTDQNPVPMLSLGYDRKVLKGRRRIVKHTHGTPKRMRTNESQPGLLSTSPSSAQSMQEEMLRNEPRKSATKEQCNTEEVAVSQFLSAAALLEDSDICFESSSIGLHSPLSSAHILVTGSQDAERAQPQRMDAATQTSARGGLAVEERVYAGTQTTATSTVAGQTHDQGTTLSADDINFYTGVSQPVFSQMVEIVTLLAQKLSFLPREDQLLLCLMRLRLGLLYGHLARIFRVSVSSVGNHFIYILGILSEIMKQVVTWLPRSYIRNTMPDSFVQNGYSCTTCILDCTEVVLQRPRKLMPRAQTYSNYKANNTVKFLMAIAPNGFIMFVSKAYGGRASDKLITKDCGICDLFMPGDEIMADRGFTLDHELQVQGIRLNTPAFTRGKSQLTEAEVTQTRRIAAVRIHVERAINRIKTYRILKQALPIASKKVISNIIFVCAGLCNLKPPLIREAHRTA
ncbi:uncharacterized protein LOC135369296 [Ornithodoros turicata]|uniref:uncharacterized protein LOC135369296 n=1 Tax=Ornithodoros turicata TaxID=34597 RepID=UPI003138D7C0